MIETRSIATSMTIALLIACEILVSGMAGFVGGSSTVHGQETQGMFPANSRESEPDFDSLGGYVSHMSEAVGFYYTVEDRPGPDGTVPWITQIAEFERDTKIRSIDEFVAHLNKSVKGVKAIRSAKAPRVIHLIAEDLLVDDYVMDRHVTFVKFEDRLFRLPGHLGSLLEGKLGSPGGFAIPGPLFGDYTTRINVSADDEIVRDVLTKAVPLEGYSRFLWKAAAVDGSSRVSVEYGGPQEVDVEPNASSSDK